MYMCIVGARKRLAFSPSDSDAGNSSAEHVLTPLQKTKRSLHNRYIWCDM